jgi:hypothetical protein
VCVFVYSSLAISDAKRIFTRQHFVVMSGCTMFYHIISKTVRVSEKLTGRVFSSVSV